MKSNRVFFFPQLYVIPCLVLREHGHLRSFRAVVCQTSMIEKESDKEVSVHCRGMII